MYNQTLIPTSFNFFPFTKREKENSPLLETTNYQLCEPASFDEMIEIFKFRYSVFGVPAYDNIFLDFDSYDRYCDHLIVKSKSTNEIAGVYRFLSSTKSKNFYSCSEFQLRSFLKLPGNKLELGRASVSPEHRNGQVIDLLWKGIGLMAKKYHADYLFGCSSLMTTDASLALSLYEKLRREGYLYNELNTYPIDKYAYNFDCTVAAHHLVEVPALLKSYLVAGAKVSGLPALDQDFGCFDYLTILNLKELNSSFKRRYFS